MTGKATSSGSRAWKIAGAAGGMTTFERKQEWNIALRASARPAEVCDWN
jgi:hypothetical protein